MTIIKWVVAILCVPLFSSMAYASCSIKGKYDPVTFISSSTSNASITSSRISGTSGCGRSDTASLRQQHFIANNQSYLLADIARGDGEYLVSFSKLMGCSSQVQNRFAGTMQSNMEQLMPATPISVVEMLSRIRAITASDALLNNSCSSIG